MTVTVKALVGAVALPNAQTTQYTAAGSTRVIIDKATATNTTGTAATLTVNVVTSGGSASASNTLISAQSIAAGASYLCPELSGHVLNPGDFVSTNSGTASALTFRMSGREVA